jgi:hypothetical protein
VQRRHRRKFQCSSDPQSDHVLRQCIVSIGPCGRLPLVVGLPCTRLHSTRRVPLSCARSARLNICTPQHRPRAAVPARACRSARPHCACRARRQSSQERLPPARPAVPACIAAKNAAAGEAYRARAHRGDVWREPGPIHEYSRGTHLHVGPRVLDTSTMASFRYFSNCNVKSPNT